MRLQQGEEEEEKHEQNGKIIFWYNFGQKWYFSERFGTQLSFDMCCELYMYFEMYGENTNTIAIPIYRVQPYPVKLKIDAYMYNWGEPE